jgi:hypothetical protein
MKFFWIHLVLLLTSTWFVLANRREEEEFERRQEGVLARRAGNERGSGTGTRREASRAEELAERGGVEDEEGEAAQQILEEKREDEMEAESGLRAREKQGDGMEQEDEEGWEEEKDAEDREDEKDQKREAAPKKIMIGYYLHPTITNTTQARCFEICSNMGENCTFYEWDETQDNGCTPHERVE